MNDATTQRIRQVAILVASLEEELGEQMLSDLPPREARWVRDEIDRLDRVDPVEQQHALDAFHKSRQQSSSRADVSGRHFTRSEDRGVEAFFSDSPGVDSQHDLAAGGASRDVRETALSRSLAGVDAETIAILLHQEHPQIIAAALSRMSYDQAAKVFAALPESTQHDVLPRITNLQPADDEAMAALEAQLIQWTTHQLQQQRSQAAGAELARRILATRPAPSLRLSPTADRADAIPTIAAALSEEADRQTTSNQSPPRKRRLPSLKLRRLVGLSRGSRPPALDRATQVQDEPSATPDATATSSTSATPATPATPDSFDPAVSRTDSLAIPPGELLGEPSPATAAAERRHDEVLEDRSRELEKLDDASLLRALRAAEDRTVRLALAASSDRLCKRIQAKLPRQEAARLRQNLFAIGPTQLVELRRAQHELLRLATQAAA